VISNSERTDQGLVSWAIATRRTHFRLLYGEKVLYGGCISEEQLGNLAFTNLTECPRTLGKLQQPTSNTATIVAGHWSPLHGPELIEQYMDLLKQTKAATSRRTPD